MPRMEIEWASEASTEKDEAMVDRIVALVHHLLEDQDPAISATLVDVPAGRIRSFTVSRRR